MEKDNHQDYEIMAMGNLVMLRTHLETDRVPYQRWQVKGEWRTLDAPWEHSTPKQKQNKEKNKQKPIEEDPSPNKMAVIATLENKPLGWVNRYRFRDNPLIWFVGISICEDDYLNRGYGSEALTLWVDYLFSNSHYHKLCLDTWSFNPRMMHVAEKLGFISEGCQREMQFWQNEWLDLVHYGMLREEWDAKH
jgi:RimJ/RimL family protein N-acetyltransferase